MSEVRKFRARIEAADGGGAYVCIPFDVEQVYGRKRVKVQAWIDGFPYRGSLVRMGGPGHILGVLKEIREQCGKSIGDEVEVVLQEDDEPRLVRLPDDLAAALRQDAAAAEGFARLAYTHQKEYARWIEQAKRAETRQKRILQTLEKLKTPAGKREQSA